jgi:transcriptional regulator with XRE-family HTH domain
MAREPIQPLREETRQLIRERLEHLRISRAELARQANIHRSLLTRIFDPVDPQRHISVHALQKIATVLGIASDQVVEQYEFELEITADFIDAAREALTDELLRLKESIGRLNGTQLTGVVGVELHGLAPQKQIFKRIFVIPTARRRSVTKPAGLL